MKQDIDSILMANYYLVTCKLDRSSSRNVEIARKYLTAIIKRALIDRITLKSKVSKKAISIL